MNRHSSTTPEPKSSWTRDRLVQWIEAHGDDVARKKFLNSVFDPSSPKLNKRQIFDICYGSYQRTRSQ